MAQHNHWTKQDIFSSNDNREKFFSMISWNALSRILRAGAVPGETVNTCDDAFEGVRNLIFLARNAGIALAKACKNEDSDPEFFNEKESPEDGIYIDHIEESRDKLLADCHEFLDGEDRIRLGSQFVDVVCDAVRGAYISGINNGPCPTNHDIHDIIERGLKPISNEENNVPAMSGY